MNTSRLDEWLANNHGAAHHSRALAAGFTRYSIATAVAEGRVRRLPRGWIGSEGLTPDIERAVAEGGSLTCVTAARAHGLWTPPQSDTDLHLRVSPRSGRHDTRGVTLHWSVGPAPVARHELVDPW